MRVRHFDQSTWLAKRAVEAARLGPPTPPAVVVLPGAKAAIPHDRLVAYQAAGYSEGEIVAQENARWNAANADQLADHTSWVRHYQTALAEMRQKASEALAEQQRRQAVFEALMAERGA